MCIEVKKTCQCGQKTAQFHLRDNILSREVIGTLYCPQCTAEFELDPDTMLADNGWIIEYDMELARFLLTSGLQLDPDVVRPGFIFDSGYACWLEMYPGEKQDIEKERQGLLALHKEDPNSYLKKISSWNIDRIEKLKGEGWRKAKAA
ncbi:MAG: hypothetical protein D3909_11750 [Candidatus Electrothrix sp. ATG1]|nr:hypothetical protein [Candidatus Electrothrix sp. ATG1]